jgi:hypothetical protein
MGPPHPRRPLLPTPHRNRTRRTRPPPPNTHKHTRQALQEQVLPRVVNNYRSAMHSYFSMLHICTSPSDGGGRRWTPPRRTEPDRTGPPYDMAADDVVWRRRSSRTYASALYQ